MLKTNVTSTVLTYNPFSQFSYVHNQSFMWRWYCSSPMTGGFIVFNLCAHYLSRVSAGSSEYALISPANMSPDSPDRRLMGSTMAAKTVGTGRGVSLTGNCSSSSSSVASTYTAAAVFGQRPKVSCCAASGLWPCTRYCLVFGAITHPSCSRLSSSLVPKSTAHCFTNLESLFDIEIRQACLTPLGNITTIFSFVDS